MEPYIVKRLGQQDVSLGPPGRVRYHYPLEPSPIEGEGWAAGQRHEGGMERTRYSSLRQRGAGA